MRFTSCIPALGMLTIQLDPLSKPVGPILRMAKIQEKSYICISCLFMAQITYQNHYNIFKLQAYGNNFCIDQGTKKSI